MLVGIIYSSAIAALLRFVFRQCIQSERLQNCSKMPSIFFCESASADTFLPSPIQVTPLLSAGHKPRIREQRLLSSPTRAVRRSIPGVILKHKDYNFDLHISRKIPRYKYPALSNGNIKPPGIVANTTTTVTFLDFSREMKGPKSAPVPPFFQPVTCQRTQIPIHTRAQVTLMKVIYIRPV